jgi:hypothetical protein
MRGDRSPTLAHLDVEELRALHRWRVDHGRTWKDALRQAWLNGRDEWAMGGHALRRIRNSYGPSIIDRFTTAQLDAAAAGRLCN